MKSTRSMTAKKLTLTRLTLQNLNQATGGMRKRTDSCYTNNNDPDCTDTCFARKA